MNLPLKPNWAGQFDTFQHWINRANRTIAEDYCPVDTIGNTVRALCIDSKGRRCQCGGDFMRARDDNAFPVYYFWDMVPK